LNGKGSYKLTSCTSGGKYTIKYYSSSTCTGKLVNTTSKSATSCRLNRGLQLYEGLQCINA
jgi:hypothetical protein